MTKKIASMFKQTNPNSSKQDHNKSPLYTYTHMLVYASIVAAH